jgi:hypothetical protein
MARRYRPAWIVTALILAVGTSLLFSPVRTLAGNLLSLFRMSEVTFVQIDAEHMPDSQTLAEAAHKLEGLMEEQLALEVQGTARAADVAEARADAGYAVRFPGALDEAPVVMLEPGLYAAGQIDLPSVRALLGELGYGGVDLPDELDGAEVSVRFGTMVSASYGECERAGVKGAELPDGCVEYAQVPAPLLSAPPELDVDRLGRAYLELLGMSAEEAALFSERVNWATTLVIPLPPSAYLGYKEIVVDGVTGTVVRPVAPSPHVDEYLLVWVRNEIVYALHGVGTTEEALTIANSLR